MIDAPAITGIDQMVVEGPGALGWSIRFRSVNTGMHHQLYVNGRLADWTDTPAQRRFCLSGPPGPVALTVVAVDVALRTRDFARQLAGAAGQCSWLHRPLLPRPVGARPGDVMEVVSDHATGLMSTEPVSVAEMCPPWAPRWAFGQDSFGEGGFGYDGTGGAGLGGAFGAGPFGMGADLIDMEAAFGSDGLHLIVLRTRNKEGQVVDSPPHYVNVCLPPQGPRGLTVAGYDTQTQRIQFRID
jgi:hypothetical protein